jgi:hypothetical protein
MPQTNGLAEFHETVLLTVWKLRGMGNVPVDESKLRSELTGDPAEELSAALQTLSSLGFLEAKMAGERRVFSLTPLGLAILRKIEEDRLQELK